MKDFYIDKTLIGKMEKSIKKDARADGCIGLFLINLNNNGIRALLDAYDGLNKLNITIDCNDGEVNFFNAICISLRISSDEKAEVGFFFSDPLIIL